MNIQTPIFFLLSVVVWATLCSTPAYSAVAGEGKFHLVYLVSTEKVEIGAKAYVEPLFFTDGGEIKSFYDYCRQYFRNAKTDPSASEIGDDRNPLNDFCTNIAFTLRGNNYFLMNNAGVGIRIQTIEFQQNPAGTAGTSAMVAPILPLAGIASISKVYGTRVDTVSTISHPNSGPQHFFLMSSNEALIRQIMPVSLYKSSETQPLLKRAQKYADETKGKINRWYLEYEKVDGPVHVKFDKGSSPRFEGLPVELVSPIYVDVDKDGLADLIIGMRSAPVNLLQKPSESEFQWAATGIVLGNNETSMIGGVSQSVSFYDRLSVGAVRHTPAVLMKLQGCSY